MKKAFFLFVSLIYIAFSCGTSDREESTEISENSEEEDIEDEESEEESNLLNLEKIAEKFSEEPEIQKFFQDINDFIKEFKEVYAELEGEIDLKKLILSKDPLNAQEIFTGDKAQVLKQKLMPLLQKLKNFKVLGKSHQGKLKGRKLLRFTRYLGKAMILLYKSKKKKK